jgi:ATP-dependent Lhr-like helicase
LTPSLSQRTGQAFYGPHALREAQRDAVGPLLGGEEVLVIAGTGSGKTEAAVAPLVDRYLEELREADSPVLVYLTPTRALANDLVARLELPLSALHVRLGAQHGERKDLARKSKPTFLITTPETFDNLLVSASAPLARVRAVVLDEVHQLAGTQRGLQVKRMLHRLEASLGRSVQVAAMSATVATPEKVWQRLRHTSPVVVEVPDSRRRRYVLRRDMSEAAMIGFFDKLSVPRKVLVFCNSRREAEQLAAALRGADVFNGRVFVHHSSLDRSVRLDVETQLRSRERGLCVATSTLELGIDIGDVDLVVLCGPPSDWKSFSQRLGRGNRRSDEVDVLCLVPPWSRRPAWDAAVFRALVTQLEGRAPREDHEGPLHGSTAQQVVSHVRGGADWERRADIVRALGHDVEADLDDVLGSLVEADVLQRHPVRPRWGLSYGFEEVEQRMEAWSNFPASASTLSVQHRGNTVGTVSYGNVMRLETGATFALQGRVWRVVRVVRQHVMVEAAAGAPTVKLVFDSIGARLDPTLVELIPAMVQDPGVDFAMGPSTRTWWESLCRHLGPVTRNGTAVWREGGQRVHATFAGRLVNEAAVRLLSLGGPATDSTITASIVVDFAGLPPFGAAWTDAVADFLETPTELTSWQQRLPPRLLREELLGPFLTHPVYPRIVQRLRTSPVWEVVDDRLSALAPEARAPRPAPK